VERNQRFLLKVVGDYHEKHPALEFGDLVSEANLGLIRAAEKFNPATGNRFTTYAKFWIRQSLGMYEDQWETAVRLPGKRADELRRIKTAMRDTGSNDPTIISAATGIGIETVKTLIPYSAGAISLDSKAKTPDGDEGESLSDLLLPVSVDFIEGIQTSELWEVLQKLPEKQREVLMHRYGAFGRKRMTLQEIADEYGITRERVRQIENQALNMCRRLGQNLV